MATIKDFEQVGALDVKGQTLMQRVDISAHSMRGKDLYLWVCGGCGTFTLSDKNGGDLTKCECDQTKEDHKMTVVAINQLSDSEREAA